MQRCFSSNELIKSPYFGENEDEDHWGRVSSAEPHHFPQQWDKLIICSFMSLYILIMLVVMDNAKVGTETGFTGRTAAVCELEIHVGSHLKRHVLFLLFWIRLYNWAFLGCSNVQGLKNCPWIAYGFHSSPVVIWLWLVVLHYICLLISFLAFNSLICILIKIRFFIKCPKKSNWGFRVVVAIDPPNPPPQ